MAENRACGSTAVETKAAPKVEQRLPPDYQLADVAHAVRSAKERRAAARRDGYKDQERLSEWESKALKLWEERGWEWYFRALKAGVARRHWLADLEHGLQTAAVEATRQFIAGPFDEDAEGPGCLVLAGRPGTGKTIAAVGGLRSLMGHALAFFDVRALSRSLMDPARRDDTLERALTTEVVVLDDVGSAYVKADSFLEGMLEEIFIAREANPHCITLVTTNLTLAQLEGVMGHRVADRLAGPWGSVHELRGAKSLRRERP